MAELYKHFSKDWEGCLDFSDESLREMYYSETHGDPVKDTNGYHHGKKWMGVAIQMWKEDIEKGYLFKQELYQDPNYPRTWLDKVLKV